MHSRTIGQVSVLRCSRCARMSALTFLIVSNGLLMHILYHETTGITIHNSTFVCALFSRVWLRKTQTVFCVRVVALRSGGGFACRAVASACQSTTSGAVGGLSACPSVTYDSCLLHALALVRIGISRANVIIRMASSIAVRLCLLCFKCLFPAVNFRRNFASHFFVVHGICQTPQAFRE